MVNMFTIRLNDVKKKHYIFSHRTSRNIQGDSVARGPQLLSNAEHRQMQVAGRVQYIAECSMLFSIVAGMCI